MLKEGLQPHKVREMLFWGSEQINYISDITETFELKIAALRCHRSQIGHLDSPQWVDRLKKRHRANAGGQDFELGEAFHREEIAH
jgi:LmbE family N-acetylglucosaminyl deacetylase